MNKFILFAFMLFALSPLTAQVNITIELNTATISGTIDPGGIFVAGGCCFGNPGDNELLDPDGDGIYTGTFQQDAGFSTFYTFLNGNCGDYGCKENIAGLACSDPANFNDRFLPPVMSDTIIRACFGTCDADGSCTIVTDSIDITFELNTETIMVDAGGIFLAGGSNFGNPGDNPMIDPDGDGVYTITVRKPQGFASYYTFTNGNCGDYSCKEDLEGLECGDPASFNDRFLSPVMSDTIVKACFGNCASDGSCTPSSVRGLSVDENLFTLRPTVVNDFAEIVFGNHVDGKEKQILIVNAAGQVVQTVDAAYQYNYRLDTSNYPPGLYLFSVATEGSYLTKKFVVSR
ncbi:MAG: T9SS type A sorting domain-containing protein [Lewinella sp.]|nr:T9SS type A sorting domain-containing protein [Lewinella sp.]